MKFILAAVAALAASLANAQAASSEDVGTIRQQLVDIVAAVNDLGDGLTAFTGPGDAATLLASSEEVVSTLEAGTAAVEPIQGQVDVQQATTELLDQVTALNEATEAAVQEVISRKDEFVEACVATVIRDQLSNQAAAATAFQEAVSSKFSAADQGLVASVSGAAIESLNEAVAAYEDQTSLPASCSGGAPGEGGDDDAQASDTAATTGPAATDPASGATTTPAADSPTSTRTPVPYTGAAPAATAFPVLALAGMIAAAAV